MSVKQKKYVWLKLRDDFFKSKEMKKLRKVAGGDVYTIIYLKMQLLSIKNDGILYFDGLEDAFEEEIALEIDEETVNVKMTIAYLIHANLLVEKSSDEFHMLEAIRNIGSETTVAARVRDHRAKKLANNYSAEDAHRVLQCNTDVTKCNTEIEKEREEEIEKDKEITTLSNSASPNLTVLQKTDEVVNIFNHWKVKTGHHRANLDAKRTARIKAASKMGYSPEELIQAIDGCCKTPHNMGKNDRGERYDSIDVIFRSADQIDRFIRNDKAYIRPGNTGIDKKLRDVESLGFKSAKDYLNDDED